MPRIRTIKPEFWTDEALTECSLSARLLFIATWNFSDDNGNLDRSAKQIKARAFPVDNIDCEPLIKELLAHGLLIEYSANEKKYLHIQGFRKHQVINRPSKPNCPAYDESLRTHGVLTEETGNAHGALTTEGRKGRDISTLSESSVIAHVIEAGVTEETAKDFLALRKKKRAPLTMTAWKGIMSEVSKAGITPQLALATCCEKGWQGFEAVWYENLRRNPTSTGGKFDGII
ncbi:MAG: hypothetical protein KGI54_18310 [Pseudomonadota bacterium]|nr:hypothetical protein [Pseudomonadota bacterium]